ncbi:MAG TPA: molybdopterin cofactor-binding domain-containing protein [Bryobacteraceae bacterium]|jgi:isoquinoline 1-oxidoreductase|nr:molybdopterin cofactor-binding domain-containing protein [Bryobacteraceae bacterium]
MNRRDFFAVLGGGVVVMLVEDEMLAQETGGGRGGRRAQPQNLNAWLHIGETGIVTVFSGKVEVGQNARTSLTQAVAEELRAPVSSIHMVLADTDLTPYDMGTVGSMTTPLMWPVMRRAAAAARETLVDLASQKWMVERSTVQVADGKVSAGSRSAGFGELTHGETLTRTIPANVALAPATEWKIAGTSLPKVNARDIVTGAQRYTYDRKAPGMLYAKVLRPPSFGATLLSLDSAATEAIPGVKVLREGDFVGVTATDSSRAERAVATLKAEWKPLVAETTSKDVYAYFKQNAQGAAAGPGLTAYTVAYIAHVPLEPRSALAEWKDGKLTVWTGSQRPFGVRSELAEHFGIPEENVRVIVPDTGSGYGGKHDGEAAYEAARLAKATGQPVKRDWTREEEMTWAYFRPGGLIEVAGKLNLDGTLAEWEMHNYNSGPSGLKTPYDVANKTEEMHQSKSPLRQGSYRGLAGTANHFARESYMDELAHSAGIDPLEFRLKNARNERLRAVLQAAAVKFGWKDRKKTPGRGFGISGGFEKGSYVANCVEVNAVNGAVKVVRVVEAFECGAIVNPEHLRNQVEGAVAMGMGGALFEHVDFAGNRILTNRLSRYRVPRFADMPVIESVLLDRRDLPSAGAGETPIMGIAPAIGNAIFDATAQRIRALPMMPDKLSAGSNSALA